VSRMPGATAMGIARGTVLRISPESVADHAAVLNALARCPAHGSRTHEGCGRLKLFTESYLPWKTAAYEGHANADAAALAHRVQVPTSAAESACAAAQRYVEERGNQAPYKALCKPELQALLRCADASGLAEEELLLETIAWLQKRKRHHKLDDAALSARDAPEQFSYRLRWALALGVVAKEST